MRKAVLGGEDLKRNWLLLIIFLLVLGLLIIPRLVIVPQVTQIIQNELKQELDAEQLQVKIKAFWGWELLMGRIPELEIQVENARVDGLNVTKAVVYGKNLLFDVSSSRQKGEYVHKSADFLNAELIIKEDDLNEFFWHEVDPDGFLTIAINPDRLSLSGKIPIFGNMRVEVSLHGHLEIIHDSYLRFVPEHLEVHDTKVPPVLLDILNESYEFALDLEIFPYPLKISRIDLLEQEIKIKMEVVQ